MLCIGSQLEQARSSLSMSLVISEAAHWIATFLDLCCKNPRLVKLIRRRNDGPQIGIREK